MIEINNLTTNRRVDEEFLKKVAQKALIGENKEKLDLSIVLVGQTRIRKLNKKYRQNYRATDVLSFTYDDSGEVIICLQEIKKNAKKFKSATELPLAEARRKKSAKPSSSFEKELSLVLIHGILHLLGYDHEKSEKAAKEMEEKEDYYLSQLEIRN